MSNRKGFTLIELLVVIAIIAILAAVLMPIFVTAKERSRMTKCVSNLRQISNGLTMYRDDFNAYPPFLASLQYRNYIKSKAVYICGSDPKKGKLPNTQPDWEGYWGFNTLYNGGKTPVLATAIGNSYAYIPRAAFWHLMTNPNDPSQIIHRGLWKGDYMTPDNRWPGPGDWINSATWQPVFDHFTPIVFDWFHAQDDEVPTSSMRPLGKKKASVLVLITGGSVLRCDHERLLPCEMQIKYRNNEYATHPRQVLH